MQTACWEMLWFRALRAVAVMLAVVLGLEWTVPLGGYAQPNQGQVKPNQESAPAPAASVGNQDFPPMQDAAIIEEPKPFYKKWWFWALVVFVVAGGVAAWAVNEVVNDPPYLGPGPG